MLDRLRVLVIEDEVLIGAEPCERLTPGGFAA